MSSLRKINPNVRVVRVTIVDVTSPPAQLRARPGDIDSQRDGLGSSCRFENQLIKTECRTNAVWMSSAVISRLLQVCVAPSAFASSSFCGLISNRRYASRAQFPRAL
ncbi:hypothetical protein ACS0VN_22505 [Salmonella enterica subsp. enterica serovar Paratyphi A]